jgi:hypothetical protein
MNETALIESVVAAVISTAASVLSTDATFSSPTLVDPSIAGNVTWSDASLNTLHVHTLDATQLHGTDAHVAGALTVHGSTAVTTMEAQTLNASLHVHAPRVQADRFESIGTRLILGDSLHTEEIQIGGRSHANVIRVGGGTVQSHLYLGGVNDMVYIQGNTSIISTTNHAVENKRFVLNAGGLPESAGLAGVYFEDGGQSNQSFVRLAEGLSSIELKALRGPLVVLDQNLATTANVQFQIATVETLIAAADIACESIQSTFNAVVGGNLTVDGHITGAELMIAGSSQFQTVRIQGDTTIQGALSATQSNVALGPTSLASMSVSGPSTLQDTTIAALSATSLLVAGTSALSNTTTMALSATSLLVSDTSTLNATQVMSLDVVGPAVLNNVTASALSTATLAVSGVATLGVTSTDALSATGLSVAGASKLQATNTTTLSALSLTVAGTSALQTVTASNLSFTSATATSVRTLDLGSVGASWSSATAYVVGDQVTYAGQAFAALVGNNVALIPTLSNNPSTTPQALFNFSTAVGTQLGSSNTITVGSHFLINVDCVITHVRMYRNPTSGGSAVYVFKIAANGASATLMATLTDPDPSPATGSWRDIPLATPMQLLVGERWTMARAIAGTAIEQMPAALVDPVTFFSPTLIAGSFYGFKAAGANWPNSAATRGVFITPVVRSAWQNISTTPSYSTTSEHQFNGMGTTSDTVIHQLANQASSLVVRAATSATTSLELLRITGTGALSTTSESSSLSLAGTGPASVLTAGGMQAAGNLVVGGSTTVTGAIASSSTIQGTTITANTGIMVQTFNGTPSLWNYFEEGTVAYAWGGPVVITSRTFYRVRSNKQCTVYVQSQGAVTTTTNTTCLTTGSMGFGGRWNTGTGALDAFAAVEPILFVDNVRTYAFAKLLYTSGTAATATICASDTGTTFPTGVSIRWYAFYWNYYCSA